MAQHFEVAVLGQDPAALLTAALLAKRGRRVLWVDNAEERFFEPHAPAFLRAPAWTPAFTDAPHIKRVHEILGLSLALRATPQAAQPLGILAPGLRLCLSGGRDAIVSELALQFPDKRTELAALVQRLNQAQELLGTALGQPPFHPAESLLAHLQLRWRQRSLARYLTAFDKAAQDAFFGAIEPGHPVRKMLLGVLPFVSHTFGTYAHLAALRGMGRLVCGMGSAAASRHAVHQALVDAMERAGVEMRHSCAVKAVHLSRRRAVSFELGNERHQIGSDFVIDGLAGDLGSLVAGSERPSQAPKERQGGMLTVNATVLTEVVPRPLAPQSLLLGEVSVQDTEPETGTLLLERRATAVGEKTILSVSIPCADVAAAGAPERQKQLFERLYRRLKEVIPFIDAGGLKLEVASRLGAAGEAFAPYPLFVGQGQASLGIGGAKRRTQLKNVFRARADINPGLGLEGAYLTALGATDLLFERAGWRD